MLNCLTYTLGGHNVSFLLCTLQLYFTVQQYLVTPRNFPFIYNLKVSTNILCKCSNVSCSKVYFPSFRLKNLVKVRLG